MTDLLAVGDVVDLTNCDREPIRVPGAIQPHGVLIALSEPDLVVRQVSANSADLLGIEPTDLIGRRFTEVIQGEITEAVEEAAAGSDDPAEHFPLSTTLTRHAHGPDLAGDVDVDVLLHRSGGLLVVEIEPGSGPMSFDSTYRVTRRSVSRINRATDPTELFDVAASEVRRLTGFDRVMVYRFDSSWNGEVVAEDLDDSPEGPGLNSFLGLRYPASDIPAQARALYLQSWLRLIPDIDYQPAALVPVDNPMTGDPLDLGRCGLRSVSPIHVEYLKNMGVRASMSISLIDKGELWGLIVCHHYAGPHRPPYEVRAAAEFLGQTLSLRLVDSVTAAETAAALAARSTLATLTALVAGERESAAHALTGGHVTLLNLLPATGVAVSLGGESATAGAVPSADVVAGLVAHAEATGVDVLALDTVPMLLPELIDSVDTACGALVLRLSAGEFIVWVRPEKVRTVIWGGDPHNKAIAAREGDTVRLSPRKSFEAWQETVRLRSEPWSVPQVELAATLRHHLLDALYGRARRLATVAETLQRSLLPDSLPELPGWSLYADYSPAAGGDVGGDWYDVVQLPSGQVACVLGDVAGHGIMAAGTMGQLRHGLRAYLMETDSPAQVLMRLSRLVEQLLPQALATATVVVVDPATGVARVASAGHPPVCHVTSSGNAELVAVQPWPPLGVLPSGAVEGPSETEFALASGESVLLYSDGLVERRTEDIDAGLARLLLLSTGSVDARQLCTVLMADCREPDGEDDATVLVLTRDGSARRIE